MLPATLKPGSKPAASTSTLCVVAFGFAALMIGIVRLLFAKKNGIVHAVLNPLDINFSSWLVLYLLKQFLIVLVWDNVRFVTGLLACAG